jgi:archaellum biogenesis ATPase FlaH
MKKDLMEKEKRKIKIEMGFDQIQDLKNEPEVKVLWEGISEGTFGLMCGVAKTGKTTFAENLAISLSVGRTEYFGKKMNGVPRKVLFVNMEESWKIRGRRNTKQLNELSVAELDLYRENYMTVPKDFPEFLNNENDWEYLRDYIAEANPDVIFIDSLTHMFSGEIEKSANCVNFVQKFKKYVTCFGKTVIVIHHNVKGNDKPIDQNNVAGSRVILQSFQFAYGFANIPMGGKYMCPLNNKEFGIDTTEAILYDIKEDGWIVVTGEKCNKYKLYKDSYKSDGRTDSTNTDLIYNYIESRSSQVSQASSKGGSTTTRMLMSEFVENDSRSMSKDTLHKGLLKLEKESKIKREKKGVYILNSKVEDERNDKK